MYITDSLTEIFLGCDCYNIDQSLPIMALSNLHTYQLQQKDNPNTALGSITLDRLHRKNVLCTCVSFDL